MRAHQDLVNNVVLVRVEEGGLVAREGDEDLVGGVVVEVVIVLVGRAMQKGDVVDHEGDVGEKGGSV